MTPLDLFPLANLPVIAVSTPDRLLSVDVARERRRREAGSAAANTSSSFAASVPRLQGANRIDFSYTILLLLLLLHPSSSFFCSGLNAGQAKPPPSSPLSPRALPLSSSSSPSSSSSSSSSSPASSAAFFSAAPPCAGGIMRTTNPNASSSSPAPASPSYRLTRNNLLPLDAVGGGGFGGAATPRRRTRRRSPQLLAASPSSSLCLAPYCRDPNCCPGSAHADGDDGFDDDDHDSVGVGKSEETNLPQVLFCTFIGSQSASSSTDDTTTSSNSDDLAASSSSSLDVFGSSFHSSERPPILHDGAPVTPLRRTPVSFRRIQQRRKPGNALVIYERVDPSSSSSSRKNDQRSRNKERLLQASNLASALCVLDCTVLPLLTIGLSIATGLSTPASAALHHHHHHAHSLLGDAMGGGGVGGTFHPLLAALHEWGHAAALYFVVPVGALAAAVNYCFHGSKRIAGMAALGLVLVVVANGGGAGCAAGAAAAAAAPGWSRAVADAILLPPGLVPAVVHALHAVNHVAWVHRAVNLSGCALLLASNYLSKQRHHQMQNSFACNNADCWC